MTTTMVVYRHHHNMMALYSGIYVMMHFQMIVLVKKLKLMLGAPTEAEESQRKMRPRRWKHLVAHLWQLPAIKADGWLESTPSSSSLAGRAVKKNNGMETSAYATYS